MSSSNTSNDTMSDLISRYASLSTPTIRDAISSFVLDHLYQIHFLLKEHRGGTPFSNSTFQSWENMRLPKAQQKPFSDKKIKVQKTREVTVDGVKKREKIAGEFEEKNKRLSKITTFNAPAKAILSFIVVSLTHETIMAIDKIKTSDVTSTRNAITSVAQENCDHCVSPLIFAICENVSDAQIKSLFPEIHGGLRLKLEPTIDKFIPNDTDLRNLLVKTIIKFLQIFTIWLSSNMLYETKSLTDDETKTSEQVGKSVTTQKKHVQQFLEYNCNILMPTSDMRMSSSFLESVTEFCELLDKEDAKRKAINKIKRAESATKRSTDDKKTNVEDVLASDDEGNDNDGEDKEDADEDDDDESEVKKTKKASDAAAKRAATLAAKKAQQADKPAPAKVTEAKAEVPAPLEGPATATVARIRRRPQAPV